MTDIVRPQEEILESLPTTIKKSTLNAIINEGNFSALSESQRTEYYLALCKNLEISPIGQPFMYLDLPAQGGGRKLVLYVTAAATKQLARKMGLTVEIDDGYPKEVDGGVLLIRGRWRTSDGRTSCCIAALSLFKKGEEWQPVFDQEGNPVMETRKGKEGGTYQAPKRQKVDNPPLTRITGDDLANLYMKIETKLKRRATLDAGGLGMPDESEIETIPGAKPVAMGEAYNPAPARPTTIENVGATYTPVTEQPRRSRATGHAENGAIFLPEEEQTRPEPKGRTPIGPEEELFEDAEPADRPAAYPHEKQTGPLARKGQMIAINWMIAVCKVLGIEHQAQPAVEGQLDFDRMQKVDMPILKKAIGDFIKLDKWRIGTAELAEEVRAWAEINGSQAAFIGLIRF